jgi:hypothetical protein
MSEYKLKMCPLCCNATQTNIAVYLEENYEGVDKYRTGCGSCGCSTPAFLTKKEAAMFWNNRVENSIDDHCPLCNSETQIKEYKVSDKQVEPFFRYVCRCGFASGVSKNKSLIVNSWIKRNR